MADKKRRSPATTPSPTKKRAATRSAKASPPRPAPVRRTFTKSIPFVQPMRHETRGEIFVVGNGDCGQLGLGEDVLERDTPAMLKYFSDKNIVKVEAGGLHNMALSKDGKLYSWGCNDQLALGRKGDETVPGPVEGLDDIQVVDVACGDSITVALTTGGRVYQWGTFRNSNGIFGFYPGINVQGTPFLMKEVEKIISIACGNNHVVCTSSDGKIYTWGDGEQGQLGHKVLSARNRYASLVPRGITFYPKALGVQRTTNAEDGTTTLRRPKRTFDRVFCGGYCTFLVHKSQAVFAYGLNQFGQLGLGFNSEEFVHEPQRVEGFNEESGLRCIAGGEHHTLLVDGTGTAYAFGRGQDGQLGLPQELLDEHAPPPFDDGKPSPCLVNSLVPIPSLSGVKWVSANGASCLAVTEKIKPNDDSNLFTWGYGDMGQLDNNASGDERLPYNVNLKGRTVINASMGGQHAVYLLAPKGTGSDT
ncbi:hypothetical protein PhCBS80983_g00854 [Powellomyces hirtus]|uniref:RCC1-like domain-containing protein n=1 Tax=Powellomyces hirtus TaxID=109895 RepID=A0A507EEV7_9FUNG|nr:hypothetical protein PhCBS80983_g00854 [Powellomyces hirtus]